MQQSIGRQSKTATLLLPQAHIVEAVDHSVIRAQNSRAVFPNDLTLVPTQSLNNLHTKRKKTSIQSMLRQSNATTVMKSVIMLAIAKNHLPKNDDNSLINLAKESNLRGRDSIIPRFLRKMSQIIPRNLNQRLKMIVTSGK